MKEAINIFKKNRAVVESYLITTIEHNHLFYCDEKNVMGYFALLPSLELVYRLDEDYKQITPYFYADRIDTSMQGLGKDALMSKVKVTKDKIFISNPYISSHTGNPCITVVRPVGDEYMVFDFNLIKVLTQIKLIEKNAKFDLLNTVVYGAIGFGLAAFSIILVLHAMYLFINHVLISDFNELKAMFQPIISLTLGLAIFDLAKTVLEHEVFYKSYSDTGIENRILTKFLISIIIALSIEALMVVFKIALSDDKSMDKAFYLIIGVSSMIVALGLFKFFSKKDRGVEQ